MGMGGVAFLLTIVCFMSLPMQFQPSTDQERSTVTITMAPGTTLAQTQATVNSVYELLRKQPEVETVYTRAFVGNGRVTAQFKEEARQ